MSTTQAAEHFGINIKTIRRWIQSGKLSAEQVDGRWHVHISGLDVPHETPNGTDNVMPLKAQLQRADSEIQHLREQLARRDEQIDHLTQLLAMQSKTTVALTEQLDASRALLEDQRRRKMPLWKRSFRFKQNG